MPKDTKSRRAAQATYQRAYRLQQKALRKPSRDDVARVALHLAISEALQDGRGNELGAWYEAIIDRLVDQGFDRNAAQRRVDQLIERYADGWCFQRKPHLMTRAG